MKVKILALICAALCFSLIFSQKLSAQGNYSRIVFIDAARALAAHPAGDAVTAIQARQEAELNPIVQQLQVLQQKAQQGQELNPQEQDQADILIRTLQSYQQRYAEEILQASEPAVQAVNQAITGIAKANGYTMVLDGNIAGQNGLGLVVYAEEGLDITDQVIAAVRQGP
ncbi:MAG: OmpH family outer membrane protein [Deinococcales bacterium]